MTCSAQGVRDRIHFDERRIQRAVHEIGHEPRGALAPVRLRRALDGDALSLDALFEHGETRAHARRVAHRNA